MGAELGAQNLVRALVVVNTYIHFPKSPVNLVSFDSQSVQCETALQ